MKFKTPSEEKVFNLMLNAYDQEFGAAEVVILVPKSWEDSIDCRTIQSYSHTKLG